MLKQEIGHDAIKLSFSKALTLIISMASAMLLSRFRTLDEYGTYSQIMLIISMAVSIFTLGLPNSITYFLAKSQTKEEKCAFLSNYFTFTTLLCLLTGILLSVMSPIMIIYFKNNELGKYIYAFTLLPWSIVIYSSVSNLLVVYQKTFYLMIYSLANSISLLAIIIFVKVYKLTFYQYMTLYVIVQCIFAAYVYYIIYSLEDGLKIALKMKLILDVLRFSIPLGFSSIIGTLGYQLDTIIVARLYSTSDYAIYTNAGRELPLTIISTSLTAVLMPQLVRLLRKNKVVDAVQLWGSATTLSYIFICLFVVGMFVYAPQVISLLYSDKYLSGVSVFRIYDLVLLLRVTYFGIILNSIGETRFIFISSIASLVLNMLLIYPLYLIFGFSGPAIATLVSILVIALFQLFVTAKRIKYPFKNILPWRELLNISLINILFGLLFYYIKVIIKYDLIIGDIMESIVFGIIWCSIYIVIMKNMIVEKWDMLNGKRKLAIE